MYYNSHSSTAAVQISRNCLRTVIIEIDRFKKLSLCLTQQTIIVMAAERDGVRDVVPASGEDSTVQVDYYGL